MKRLWNNFKKLIIEQSRSLDKDVMYVAFLLLFCGVFLTLAASPAVAERNHFEWMHFIVKHLVFVPIAIGVLFGTALLPIGWARRLCYLVLMGGILGMMLVFVGPEVKGARRWISLFGISIQPSEFVKPAFAVVCGWLLAKGRLIQHTYGRLIAFILTGIICFLLWLQPDFGMLLTIGVIFAVELFLSGIPKWVVGFLVAGGAGAVGMAFLFLEHVRTRILNFFNHEEGLPYQVEKSMATLKSAGWFGKGPGEGVVKYELPDAHTDFIMAVSAEEFGFLITAFVILIFAFLVWRVTKLVMQENNLFSQIAAGGLLAQITFQSLVNISSTLNLIPTKGMTLPFISYGGSSLVSVAFAFGLILSLTHGHTFSRGLE